MNFLILFFGVAGVILSTFLAVSNTKDNINKQTLVKLILVGSFFLIGKEIVSHIVKEEGENNKSEILKEIRSKVVNIEDLVANLDTAQLNLFAREIIIDPPTEYETDIFISRESTTLLEKSNYEAWHRYFAQIDETLTNGLLIEFNGTHTYLTNLMLIYLFTNGQSFERLEENDYNDWFSTEILEEPYFNHYIETKPFIDIVLFSNEDDVLIGYAHTRDFTNELALYSSKGREREIETHLNKKHLNILNVKALFPSISDRVIRNTNLRNAVRYMAQMGWNESIVIEGEEVLFVDISNIIKIK